MKDLPFEKVSPAEAKAATDLELDAPKPPARHFPPQREGREPQRPDVKELFPWIQQLPPDVRPKALIVQYARIANKLAKLWKQPVACEKYFNELMLDERGDRKGFPPEVALELAALQGYFSTHVMVHHFGVWGERIGE